MPKAVHSNRNQEAVERFRVLRESNLDLLKRIARQLWNNYSVHQERGHETVAHIVRMIAGHDVNHLRQVEGIVKGTR